MEGKEPMLQDLHAKAILTSKVDRFLAHLDDSSNQESEDDDKSKKNNTRGRHQTLKSGKATKLTRRIVNPVFATQPFEIVIYFKG